MRLDFQELLLSPTQTYEEGLRFFEGGGMLNETLKRLVADLEAHLTHVHLETACRKGWNERSLRKVS